MKNPERTLFRVPVADIGDGGFPDYRVNWTLKKNRTFDEITGASLSEDIKVMGLDCPETNPAYCETYIDNVQKQMTPGAAEAVIVGQHGAVNEVGAFVRSVNGEKTIGEVAVSHSTKTQYQIDNGVNPEAVALMDIVNPTHFDWLKTNTPSALGPFAGETYGPQSQTGQVATVEAIQNLFYSVVHSMSAAVPTGITWDSIKSILVKAITANKSTDVANYSDTNHRIVVFTSEPTPIPNTDPIQYQTEWVGAFRIDWTISVENYKHKAKHGGDKHFATVTVTIRSISFSDADTLAAYDNAVKAHFAPAGSLIGAVMTGFPIGGKPEVFKTKPIASHDTFNKGVRVGTGEQEYRLILYSSDLKPVVTEDNTQSKATVAYQESVTVGFTMGVSTKFGISSTVGVNVEIFTASLTLSFELTLSASWNKSRTKTFTITCPPEAITYAYQGILQTAILTYDPDTFEFSYISNSDNTLTTNYIVTSQTPLI